MEHKVTALRIQKNNRERVNVYLDGEFAFGLARIVAAWLSVGQELSDERIAKLQAEDNYEAAYQRALQFLSFRIRTEKEVRKNLEARAIPNEAIDLVIERLKKNGLLNDTYFAQSWVENRSDFRPRSKRVLAYELRSHGIEAQTIEDTLMELNDEELAYQAAIKQAKKLSGLDWVNFRRKLLAFLARRGFDYQVSTSVTSAVWAEQQELYYE